MTNMEADDLVERLNGGKCPRCHGWGEVAYGGEMVSCDCFGKYEAPVSMKTRIAAAALLTRQSEELAALRAYARETSKALTRLSGGGSEMFRQLGEDYYADPELCATRTEEKIANARRFARNPGGEVSSAKAARNKSGLAGMMDAAEATAIFKVAKHIWSAAQALDAPEAGNQP